MSKVFSHLCSKSVSRRTLARLLAAVFFLSLIPLILIALYNYPADDDYCYALPGATAWVQTLSLIHICIQKLDALHGASPFSGWPPHRPHCAKDA